MVLAKNSREILNKVSHALFLIFGSWLMKVDLMCCTVVMRRQIDKMFNILSRARGAGSPVKRQSSKPRRDTVR